ncbi:MAG TPA: nodulation protein NfeD [Firmicutes bacterium]|nr:nodulation protein NfeD [Bacillota bacterium]
MRFVLTRASLIHFAGPLGLVVALVLAIMMTALIFNPVVHAHAPALHAPFLEAGAGATFTPRSSPGPGTGAAGASGDASEDGGVPVVYVINIEGTIEPGLAAYVKRAMGLAEQNGVEALVFEIDTFGGRVDAATEIRDLILDTPIPTIGFVKGRAWSAGALITLATTHIAMAPSASIGAAEPRPVDEKTISALRAEFEATAEARGRDARIAAAMVDKDIEIKGLVGKGKILTMAAKDAEARGFIDFVGTDRKAVLKHFGYGGAYVKVIPVSWSETLARYITDPLVSSILLTIGFLGLVFEVLTPGWGIPGTTGVIALALFFGGRLVAGIAGWEVVLLFTAGFLLLLLEIFVIPGFGVAGVAGIGALLASIFLSFGNVRDAAFAIAFALVLTVLVVALTAKYLNKTRLWRGIILDVREATANGYVSGPGRQDYLGRVGRALTVLRPAGIVQFGDEKLDAVSEGEYIPAGSIVRVVKVEGSKLIVRAEESS